LVGRVRSCLPDRANCVWTRIAADLCARENVAVWGEPREDFALQRALKRSLDPRGTFSPGRFVGRM
jgi:FAD/FMN-containing dehydrogenase